ncbi:MAG: hypothetical protein K1X57_03615 [Gemmataceae bacterium]|nr:hypothetical protein [Gemmataceae bacterium]
MNVVVRAWTSLRRLTEPGVATLAFVVLGLLAIETAGRHSPSDLYDVIALLLLVPLGLLVAAQNRKRPVPGIAALASAMLRAVQSVRGFTFQMGFDFRGQPPVKRGTPPAVSLGLAGLIVICAVAGLASAYLPHGFRAVLIQVTYLGYLAGLVVFWVLLSAATLLTAFVPFAFIHDWFVSRHSGKGRRSRRGEVAAMTVWFGGLFLLGAAAPLWLAPALCAVLLLAYLVGSMPSRPATVSFLWRPRESIRVRSLTWTTWVTYEFLLIGYGIVALTLLSCGAMIRGDELAANVMPVTTLLGVALAWLGPGFLGLLCTQMLLGRFRDPARPARPVAHVTLHAGDRGQVRQIFARRGWGVSFAAKPAPLDVRIALVGESLPRATEDDRWPRTIALADLDQDGTFVRLARRDEIQKRRQFLGALESLLKLARQKAGGGCGLWVSPHYWFVSGLLRDSAPGEDGDFNFRDDPILSPFVGVPFSRVFPRPVRHHLHQILRGTQIDLIFLEDGVSFKRFRRVLRTLFEVYDIHGGTRPIEEIDFRGLPGIRSVIHEYQFDEPYSSNTYPEPKYEFLGRARILHVFRDRGGDEALSDSPFDFGRRPEPVSHR